LTWPITVPDVSDPYLSTWQPSDHTTPPIFSCKQVLGEGLYADSTAYGPAMCLSQKPWHQFAFEVDVKLLKGTNNVDAQIIFDDDNDGNRYAFVLDYGNYEIRKDIPVSPYWSILVSGKLPSYFGQTFTMGIIAKDNSLSLFVNHQPLLIGQKVSLTGGYIGVGNCSANCNEITANAYEEVEVLFINARIWQL